MTRWWGPRATGRGGSRRRRTALGVVLALALLTDALSAVHRADPQRDRPGDFSVLRGVNVYTLEDVRHSTDGSLPLGEPRSSYTYLAQHGVRLVRLAVPWMKLQPVPAGADVHAGLSRPLSSSYLGVVRAQVTEIERAGMFPVLDLHNGCDYPDDPPPLPADEVSCGAGLTQADVVQVWTRLSAVFADDDRIAAYDLFNEPSYDRIGPAVWRSDTQAVVSALRARGDRHTVWVEAMIPRSMRDLAPDGPWVTDPLHRVEYSAHFYPDYKGQADGRFTGRSANAPFLAAITDFGRWCDDGQVHCSIGELGWPGGTRPPTDRADQQAWNALGEQAYALADRFGLDVTYFGAASNSSSTLWAYGASASALPAAVSSERAAGITRAFGQATVVERHGSIGR